jgi:protoheme IX farnesyltransferase
MKLLAPSWPGVRPAAARSADFVELARPRLTLLSLMVVAFSYLISRPAEPNGWVFGHLVAGGLWVLAGASVWNQVLEREADGRMRRTANRPLPAGRVRPGVAAAFGSILVVVGLVELAWGVGWLAAVAAAAGLFSYLVVYTPLKQRTSLATVVGAVPGAMPVLIGWAAAGRGLGAGAWVLFAILFLWQVPHFLAIAWMYRADYVRAGFRVLPAEDPTGGAAVRQIVVYCTALLMVSLVPSVIGLAGPAYFAMALVLGLAYLASGLALGARRTGPAARRLLKTSVLYLPLLLGAMAIDAALHVP